MKKEKICLIIGLVSGFLIVGETGAQQWAWENENIANTKHNLSSNGPQNRTVVTSVNEICVFCHTPHAAQADGPLWNRSFSQASYTMYLGTQKDTNWKGSFDARMIGTTQSNPTGYSKLCLSCHDGSIALTKVLNAPGSGAGSGPIGGSSIFMPFGSSGWSVPGEQYSGDTRRLGTDLSNDHPVSFMMSQAVRAADKELSKPDDCATNTFHYGCNEPNWTRKDGVRLYPLDFGGSVNEDAIQCTSCHNPHNTNTKFLRGSLDNLYPGDTIPPGETENKRSQICEACHVKPGWVKSTHEDAFLLFKYRDAPSEAPELDGKTVAQHGCVNCHDPHTMQGADRLHRNGAGKPGDTYGPNANDSGKTPAIENTCYQCHINTTDDVPNLYNVKNFLAGPAPFLAPDIKSVFDKNLNTSFDEMESNGSSMPLDRSWPTAPTDMTTAGATNGIHQPVFVSQDTMNNRQDYHDGNPNTEEKVLNKPLDDSYIHVECVDCHNPHQVNRFNRLKGMKGITTIGGDIIGGDSGTLATDNRQSYDGPENLGGAANIEPLVYEICFRCHGDSYNYNMPYRAKGTDSAIPGPSRTPERNRGHRTSTDCPSNIECGQPQFGAGNKRKEFNPASSHWLGGTYTMSYNTSYHPVNAPGRNGTVALYNQLAKAFKLWEIGNQAGDKNNPYLSASQTADAAAALSQLTIQCTDCHNSSVFSDPNNTGNPGLDITIQTIDGIDIPTNANNVIFGPLTGLSDGTSYRRPTDRPSNIPLSVQLDPTKAQGPHGSDNPRILRAPYNTNLRPNDPGTISLNDNYLYNNFGLCFQCHERAVFFGDGPSVGTNFGKTTFSGGRMNWNNNLHRYHLSFTGAYCHECHNNVHSNVEANNTIYGDGNGNYLPPDGHDGINDQRIDTHLINFGPQATGQANVVPNWFYNSGTFRCNLTCHGINMSACSYTHGSSSGTRWSCGAASLPW